MNIYLDKFNQIRLNLQFEFEKTTPSHSWFVIVDVVHIKECINQQWKNYALSHVLRDVKKEIAATFYNNQLETPLNFLSSSEIKEKFKESSQYKLYLEEFKEPFKIHYNDFM